MLKRRGRKRTRTFWTTLRRRSRSPGSVRRNPPRTGPAPPPRRRPPAPPSPPTRRDRIRSRETFRDGDFSFFFFGGLGETHRRIGGGGEDAAEGAERLLRAGVAVPGVRLRRLRATRAAGTCSRLPHRPTRRRAQSKKPASSHAIPNQPNPLPS